MLRATSPIPRGGFSLFPPPSKESILSSSFSLTCEAISLLTPLLGKALIAIESVLSLRLLVYATVGSFKKNKYMMETPNIKNIIIGYQKNEMLEKMTPEIRLPTT